MIIHTLEISKQITNDEYQDFFKKHKKQTYPNKKVVKKYGSQNDKGFFCGSLKSEVLYQGVNELHARQYSFQVEGKTIYKHQFISIINPMKLIGSHSRLALYTGAELYQAIVTAFKEAMEKMKMSYVSDFSTWTVKRIDYCTNIYLPSQDFVVEYLKLLQHGKIPYQYLQAYEDNYNKLQKERNLEGKTLYDKNRNVIPPKGIQTYDSRLYREMHPDQGINEQKWGSYWVLGVNDAINIYNKYDQLSKQENVNPEYLEESKPLLRIEKQIKEPNRLNHKYNEHTKGIEDPFNEGTSPFKYVPYREPSTLMRSGISHYELSNMVGGIEVSSSPKSWRKYYDNVYLRSKDLHKFIEDLRKEKQINVARYQSLKQFITDVNRQGGSIWKVKLERINNAPGDKAKIERDITQNMKILNEYGVSAVTIRDKEIFRDEDGNIINIKWLPSVGELLREAWKPDGRKRIDEKLKGICTMKLKPSKDKITLEDGITFNNATVTFTVSHVDTGKKVEELNPPLSKKMLDWFYEEKARADRERGEIHQLKET